MSVNAPFGDVICPSNVNFSRFFSISFTFWIVVNCILCLAQSLYQAKFTMIFPSMFIVLYPITLLVSYVWKVSNETMLPFVGSIFLCSLFTRHFNSQFLKIIFSIFFSVFDLLNYCKFQKPMTKPILKESVAK